MSPEKTPLALVSIELWGESFIKEVAVSASMNKASRVLYSVPLGDRLSEVLLRCAREHDRGNVVVSEESLSVEKDNVAVVDSSSTTPVVDIVSSREGVVDRGGVPPVSSIVDSQSSSQGSNVIVTPGSMGDGDARIRRVESGMFSDDDEPSYESSVRLEEDEFEGLGSPVEVDESEKERLRRE